MLLNTYSRSSNQMRIYDMIIKENFYLFQENRSQFKSFYKL